MDATYYNVSFILTNSVVIVTVGVSDTIDREEIVKAAAELTHSVDGIDVSRAYAEVEEAYV